MTAKLRLRDRLRLRRRRRAGDRPIFELPGGLLLGRGFPHQLELLQKLNLLLFVEQVIGVLNHEPESVRASGKP